MEYRYDKSGRETARLYGNGVRQETEYDRAGRTILIRELDSRNALLRAEGYVYDARGRRSHSVDESGRITKYEYDNQSRLKTALYPWTEEKAALDRKEAEEAGLYFTLDKGVGERYTFTGAELTALRALLDRAGPARGNAVGASQLAWRETYAYDRNGNRASKTTPWGTIVYAYDAENRLVKHGDIVYTYDRDGNLISEQRLRREAAYRYNGANRMTYSTTDVPTHIREMQNDIQGTPNNGANLVFHGGNHAMLLYQNDDGTVDIAHTSSKPGHSESESFANVQEFENDWGRYGDIQYVPLAGTPPANAPAIQPSLPSGEPIQVGGKNQ